MGDDPDPLSVCEANESQERGGRSQMANGPAERSPRENIGERGEKREKRRDKVVRSLRPAETKNNRS